MLTALKKGDRVLTTGGIYGQGAVRGERRGLAQDRRNVKIKVAKSAIGALVEGSTGE
jgi:preprotein translocase subunit YajC